MRHNATIRRSLLAAALAGLALGMPAQAQPQAQPMSHAAKVDALAQVLGAMHYLRSLCVGAQRQTWRDSMMELIRLEQASGERRDDLIRRFNDAYYARSRAFPACTREATAAAQGLADEGQRLIAELRDSR